MVASKTDRWGSRLGLILAMAGNAVGLGNFLRFPVQAVQNGGGAFLIPYLVCFVVMGIPLLWTEWAMGRWGGRHGHHSPPYIMASMHPAAIWKYVGMLGVFSNLVIASYYCYIESWTLSYSLRSVLGWFHGQTDSAIVSHFENYVGLNSHFYGIPGEAIFFFILCVVLNSWILGNGLKGIERMAQVGMPLLILFGVFLVITALTSHQTAGGTYNPWEGVNFLWTPQFDSLWQPKVWLAAAGQIFFTLSVGMGTIHCYASYLDSRDDIALNGLAAGFTNEFVEIVLGSLIVVPIAAGFLGLDWIKEHIGFGVAFQTMPYLFDKWGLLIGSLSGLFWFGLLFFAGITSSLAMGMPWISFLRDRFGWNQKKAAFSFGTFVLVLGLPTVLLFNQGVFNEYDYWGGTVGLVVFAMAEMVLFAWFFGSGKSWNEINLGADIRVPRAYRFIITRVTPVFMIVVLLCATFTPENSDWVGALKSLFSGGGWRLDNSSIIGQLMNSSLNEQLASATGAEKEIITQKITWINLSRTWLVILLAGLSFLVYLSSKKPLLNRQAK